MSKTVALEAMRRGGGGGGGAPNGSKMEQSAHPMSYTEAKSFIASASGHSGDNAKTFGTEEGSIQQLDRAAQVTIFRLGTGH